MKSRPMLAPCGALALLLATAIPAGAAQAASVLIKNASFEQDALTDGGYVIVRSPTGWSSGGNAGWQNPTSPLFPTVPDGAQTGFIGGGGGPSRGSLSQILGEGVAANSRYTLSVDVGRRPDIRLDNFVVELLSGNTLLSSGTYTEADILPGQFRTLALTYDSVGALAAPLSIRLRAIGTSSDYRQVNFDNIRLEYSALASAAPEPSSWAMMILGIGMTGTMLRRRKSVRGADRYSAI